ncbi:MAG: exonuclease domain-containing protein [Clostridiales bacterium]|nr:exonuclease domain-containing protein [Clostridiales bacterium]
MRNAYMAIDIETTGLSPDNAQIIEIGAVVIEDKKEVARFSRLINPGCSLPQRIVELTGITDEMLSRAAYEAEVVGEFLDFCNEVMANYEETDIILGHNVAFDYSFIKTAAVRLNRSFERKAIDTLQIARKFHSDLPSKSLDNMCAYYGIAREISHRAFEDAIAASDLYERMKEKFSETEADAFEAVAMLYTPKKQEPMTLKQKKYLLDLVNYHQLEIPDNLDDFTKSKASRYIDKIILEHGMISRR